MTLSGPRAVGAALLAALAASQAALVVLNPLLPDVARDLDISVATAGQLRTVSGLVAGIAALTAGLWAARIGLRELLLGGVTTVVREFNDFETLPPGEGAFDIFVTKATLKWDVAPFFVIITELRYSLDRNRTKFVKADNESGRERIFQDANVVNRLGFFILAQARW